MKKQCQISFLKRVEDKYLKGSNPYRCQGLSSDDYGQLSPEKLPKYFEKIYL